MVLFGFQHLESVIFSSRTLRLKLENVRSELGWRVQLVQGMEPCNVLFRAMHGVGGSQFMQLIPLCNGSNLHMHLTPKCDEQ